MSADLTGRVVAVNTVPLGDVLAADAPAGSTSLVVDDAADFSADGGFLILDSTEVVAFTTADDETGIVTLSTPITGSYLAEDRVDLYDNAHGAKISETVAEVAVEGTDQGGDTLEATVVSALIAYLPEGIRDSSFGVLGEPVRMEQRGDDLFVVDLLTNETLFDGTVIDPATIPANAQVQADLDNLNDVVIPQLQTDLSATEAKFPVGTTDIQDDAITTPKIIAGAVITEHMTADSIAGDRIAVNTLAGDRIVANSITADHLEANLLLSTKIVAGAALTGARIELLAAGLLAYNASGAQTVEIDAATGNVTIQGEFGTSGPTAAGVHISSNTFAGIYGLATYPTIEFNNGGQGTAGNRQPQIFTDTTGNSNLYVWGGSGSTSKMPQLKLDIARARLGLEGTPGDNEITGSSLDLNPDFVYLNSEAVFQSPGTEKWFAKVQLDSVGVFIGYEAPSSGWLRGFQHLISGKSRVLTDDGLEVMNGNATTWEPIFAGDGSTIHGELHVDAAIQMNGTIQTGASAFQFTGPGGGTWKEVNTGSLNANGSIMATNNLGFQGPTTGSFNANVNWNSSSGNFRVNTSSRRYKEAIEDMELDTALALSLRPRTFERNDEEDDEGNPIRTGHRYVGFIAEEAHDLGLGEWVTYDAEGPWSFAYDYWVVALQAIAREQNARIEALEALLLKETS